MGPATPPTSLPYLRFGGWRPAGLLPPYSHHEDRRRQCTGLPGGGGGAGRGHRVDQLYPVHQLVQTTAALHRTLTGLSQVTAGHTADDLSHRLEPDGRSRSQCTEAAPGVPGSHRGTIRCSFTGLTMPLQSTYMSGVHVYVKL